MTPNPAPDIAKSVAIPLEIIATEAPRLGRPRLMSLRIFAEVCRGVERGQAITRSCDYAGISYRRFREYVCRSPRLQERLARAMELRQQVRREEALRVIQEAAARGNWLASAWFLERVWPSEFALRSVSRPDPERDEPEPEVPSEIIAKHRELMLQLVQEDAESRLSEIPKLKTVP